MIALVLVAAAAASLFAWEKFGSAPNANAIVGQNAPLVAGLGYRVLCTLSPNAGAQPGLNEDARKAQLAKELGGQGLVVQTMASAPGFGGPMYLVLAKFVGGQQFLVNTNILQVMGVVRA